MDMNYISDPGFQNSLINTIEDRMIFKSVCFNNPVFMGVQLVEAIRCIPGVVEVSYEGCTSNLFITLAHSKNTEKAYNTIINGICIAISNIIMGDGIYENYYEAYKDKLIMSKLTESKAMIVQDVYNWLMSYIQNPSNFLLFCKILKKNIGTNELIINFG